MNPNTAYIIISVTLIVIAFCALVLTAILSLAGIMLIRTVDQARNTVRKADRAIVDIFAPIIGIFSAFGIRRSARSR